MPNARELEQRLREAEEEKARLALTLERQKTHYEAQIEQKDALLAEQQEQLTKQSEKLAAQQLEIKLLLEKLFASRSERYIEDPDQLKQDLGIEDAQVDDAVDGLQEAIDEQEIPGYTRRRGKKRGNGKLPEHLPRREVIIEASEAETRCHAHGEKQLIGFDTTETLEYTPPKLGVLVTKYPKYACKDEPACGVSAPERNPGLVEGNRYDSSVAAQVVTAKYGYHLPVYRQQDVFAGSGWTPSRSTLLNLLAAVATLIRPLCQFFADQVRRDSVVGTDDTGVTLLLPKTVPKIDPDDPKSTRVHEVIANAKGEDKSHVKAKMWVYLGMQVPLNVFDFTVSRHRDGPDLFLIDNDYLGTLLGDCYGANTGIVLRSDGSIAHAACNAHARRKVFEARDNHPVHASTLLGMYQELYDIEDRGTLDADGLLQLRQTESAAVVARMRDYLNSYAMNNVLPKEAMGKAVGYLNNQWDALTLFLNDASIPIDNNRAEQLMKQVAIGRKNWLFIGSVEAGYRAADLMTLVSSAIRNDLDVWAYVKGVIDALVDGCQDYASLRPDVWAATHPAHVRTYRVDERRDRADRKQRRRALRRQANARTDPS